MQSKMKYIKWFVFAILDVLFNVAAYITDPIVLLFADEVGNLPRAFIWWENWDDHLDVSWMIYENHVPKFAKYDFNKHYRYHAPEEAIKLIGEYRGYVDLLDGNFTTKERLQRYICRLFWLWRNNAYGFSYYVTGIDICKADVTKIKTVEKDGYIYYVTDYAFCYKDERKSFAGFCWDNYVGWKFRRLDDDKQRCMLAFRITPFYKERK